MLFLRHFSRPCWQKYVQEGGMGHEQAFIFYFPEIYVNLLYTLIYSILNCLKLFPDEEIPFN